MSQFSQNQTAGAYPPAPVSTGPYTASPPPGYPTRDASYDTVAPSKVKTKSKGDGFWKGCLAALCCCCAIDVCCG